jgi:dihydroorotase
MNVLIREATIADPQSPHHRKQTDILIENGKIAAIRQGINVAEKIEVVEAKNCYVSPGWFDMQVHGCDPGMEYKEDLKSVTEAAAAGGFTGIAILPDTIPALHSKSEIEYVKGKSAASLVSVYPIGAITKNREGNELAEMYDMAQSGAVAFSDAPHSVMQAGVMLRALLYIKKFNGVLISQPDDFSLSAGGQMHEGVVSTQLGMNGIPALAEELMVIRDCELAAYTQSRLHFQSISTAGAVNRIREYKKKGVPVTAAVNPAYLVLHDDRLHGYDSLYKTFPPLRSKEHSRALLEGLQDGTIDVLASDHSPQNKEKKEVEFEYAEPGMINLQTSFAISLLGLNETLSIEQLIHKFSINPRKILGLPAATIRENEKADLTIFHPDVEWEFNISKNKSRSFNSPFLGSTLKGKALAVYNNNQFKKN